MSTAIKRGGFQKGHKLAKGRPKGSPNKTTADLKEAILQAGALAGADGKGKDGMQGYLTNLAKSYPPVYAGLLGKVLPMTVAGDPEAPLHHTVEWLPPSD